MEHRASLLVGILGFGFVAYVLIKLASQINTHPDLDHFTPPPTRPPRAAAPGPSPTPTVDVAEVKRVADWQRSTMELLVDVAASQYVDRARAQLRQSRYWVPEDIPCTLSAKGPLKGDAVLSAKPPREGVWVWAGTFRCMNETDGYEITFPVNLVFEDGRWEIDASTQKVLSEGGYLGISMREMTRAERSLVLTPALRPTIVFPGRSGL